MSSDIDESYLTWLYARTGSTRERNPSKTYWTLFRQLYNTEFVSIVHNDENRVEDGRDLRYRFIDDEGIRSAPASWMRLGCSVLEMFVALSEVWAFEADRTPQHWFWVILRNLELSQLNDVQNTTGREQEYIAEILDRLISRTYEPNGRGGIFPLRHPDNDQREVEIWYQLCAYILERV